MLTGFQLVKKFPTFYGTRRFITAFTSARHLSLSWTSSIQFLPTNPTSWRSSFILSFHLSLGLPSGLFPSGFPTKTLYAPLFSPHTRYMPRPSHFSRRVKIIQLFILQFPPLPCYLVPPRPKHSPQRPFLKRLNLYSSLNVSDQISHPYKTSARIIVLYVYSTVVQKRG